MCDAVLKDKHISAEENVLERCPVDSGMESQWNTNFHKAHKVYTLPGTGLRWSFSWGREKLGFQRRRYSSGFLSTAAELVCSSNDHEVPVLLRAARNHYFHKGGNMKQPEIITSTGEYHHIPSPVWLKTLPGHCSFFWYCQWKGNVDDKFWWKITGVISASENCHVFKCLT